MARMGLHPPFLAAPASGCLWGGMRALARMLRPLTRRGCPNGAPQARSEFHGAPRKHPDAGLPSRGRRLWGAYRRLLSCRAQERRSPAGANPGLRALQIPHPYSQAPSNRDPNEHGQALETIVFIVTGVPLQRAETGVCARRRSNFLSLRRKKVTKERATLQAASLRCATGNLRCSRPAGSRSNSLHCVALKQSRALIRWPLCSSAHPEGNPGIEHPHGPSLRSAGRVRRVAPAPLGAERSDGP